MRLSAGVLVAYATPALGLAALLFTVQFFFLKYGAEVLLLSPATVGALMAVAKLWDAVSDPVIGAASDRYRGAGGRRRPFMWGALPVMGLGFLALWAIPVGVSPLVKVALVTGALLVFYTGFTLHSVPHVSFGVELSPQGHQRVRAFGVRHVFWTVGLFAAFAVVQLGSGKDQPAVLAMMGVVVVGALLLCAVTPALLRPTEPAGQAHSAPVVSGYLAVLGQPGTVTVFSVWFIENLGAGVVGGLAPFYADYVLERPDLVGVLPAVYALAGIASVPVWITVSRAWGKKATWLVAMVLGAIGFALTYFSVSSVPLLYLALVLAGASMGCGGVMAIAVMGDLVDALERRSGIRQEGAFTGLLNLGLKVGIALSVGLGGVVLSSLGFEANQVQSADTRDGIRLFFAAFPAVAFLLAAAVFARYPEPTSTRDTVD
ncbi:MAG: MFS transporter [Pseudomonadota bacterium]